MRQPRIFVLTGLAARGVAAVVLGLALALFLAACGSDRTAATPQERTVHVSGIACSQPREGVGVDLGNGLVLTSGHVLDGLTKATVIRSADVQVPARIVHIDRRLDVGVLAIDAWLEGTVAIADIQADEAGTVYLRSAEGQAAAVDFTVDRRIRAQTLDVGRENDIERPSIQLSAILQRGDSGAGLWDEQERLVGVLWAISTSVNNRAFAVQGDELGAVLDAASTDPSGASSC